jgi:two-component system LytT family response regulator
VTEGAHQFTPRKRILIVDDERPARDDLRRLVGDNPNFEIVAEVGNLADAEVFLRAGQYDVVLLDVMLRGGNGFDLVPSVRPGAAIIFVTGYEKFAVRAFEANALDYLVKPVSAARLKSSLEKLLVGKAAEASTPELTVRFTCSDQVFLKTDNETACFVKIPEIAAILSNENYSEVCLTSGKRFLVRRTMKVWEDLLPLDYFVRVHRTAIVALNKVQAAEHEGRENTLLTLEGIAFPVKARRDLWAEIVAKTDPSKLK